MKIIKQKRLDFKLIKQSLLFIITLTVGVLFSCKNEKTDLVSNSASSHEKAWMEDYAASPFVWGFMDLSGNFVIPPKYDEVRDFSEGLAAANLNGKWGYIDQKGISVIEHSYQTCGDFSEGIALVQNFDRKFKFIDTSGKVVTDCPGEECTSFSNGFAICTQSGLKGIINKRGQWLIQPQYTEIQYGYKGQFIVQVGMYYGLMDTLSNWIIPASADKISVGNAEKYLVKRDKKTFFFNPKGKKVETGYAEASLFLDDLAVVRGSKEYQIVTPLGKVVYSSINKMVGLGSGRFAEWQDKEAHIIDSRGNRLSEKKYEGFLKFSNGLLGVMSGDFWGYVDRNGNELITPSLPLAWDCKETRIRYISQNGYGFLDTLGQVMVEAQYPEARDFQSGLARVAVFR